MTGAIADLFSNFVMEEFELPLSYDLVLDALAYLQRYRNYRFAIVQAETAVEVHVRSLLLKLMLRYGKSESEAEDMIENDGKYWGVKSKIRRLDDWTAKYATDQSVAFTPFVDSVLYRRWDSDLYGRRNSAVHAGAGGFSYDDASRAIGIAKECIASFEASIPGLQNRIRLNPSMSAFRLNPGEVMF